MGLDMYLHGVINSEYDDTNESIAGFTVVEYTVEVGYWRKANHIHNWFVQHCQDGIDECQSVPVSRDQLKELWAACYDVLAHHDEDYAMQVLPPSPGFFFGSTEIGDWYWEDLRDTIAIIKQALESKITRFVYRASW